MRENLSYFYFFFYLTTNSAMFHTLFLQKQRIGSESESMKMESDTEIKNLFLQINTGNVEINHTYADRDAANKMNIKMLKFSKCR